jgi:hypothetical protein
VTEERCRSCGGRDLAPILSLGRLPLANALLTDEQLATEEARYPLDLVFCASCALVQITETVPPEEMFREYLYFSSFSQTFLRHAETLVARLVGEHGLGPGSLAMEIASNDGYLLQFYKRSGASVLGIEPARNVALVAEREHGIPTVSEFFGRDLARQLLASHGGADVLHAHNVLAHVADLNGFVEGIALMLKPEGVGIVEVPYVKEMVDRCEFDTIYHEHLCYFSLTALTHLLGRHGLAVVEVEHVPVHGGSLRLVLSRTRGPGVSVQRLLAEEAAWGVGGTAFYASFADRVRALTGMLRDTLHELRQQGRRIAGYGAAAKAAVLLNVVGIDRSTVEYVVDRSPHKQGRHIPGVRVPIHGPERLLADRPDDLLILAWNLAPEIMEQQREYRARGGRFIVPVPAVEIVG